MKRKILLIRHGQATFNVEHRLPGQLPGIALTEEGKRQAQQTGEALAGLPISAIISSPLERARDTAALVARPRDIPIQLDADLADTNVGKWAGMNYNELSKSDDAEWKLYARTMSAAPPGVESGLDVQARAVRAAERARRAPDLGEYVALVAHADVIKLIVAYYTGMPHQCIHSLSIDNASVTMLAFGEHEHPPAVLALNWTPSPGWLTYTPEPPAETQVQADGQVTAAQATTNEGSQDTATQNETTPAATAAPQD
ncbi:MAG TPA: histidine phosphatase family protein [Ktedonobacterales bacterium]|jgi:probable phosphoglycerate mutase